MADEQLTRYTDFKDIRYKDPASKTSRLKIFSRIVAFFVLAALVSEGVYLGTHEVYTPDFLG